MKLTVKDMAQILGFLNLTKKTTETAIRDSKDGGAYNKIMKQQLEEINSLIWKIENIQI